MSRWVRVDDTNSAINYADGWTTSNGQSFTNQGNFGRVYRSSLHSTTGRTSFSYTYNGGSGRIYGTTDIRNTSGILDPVWTCNLDGRDFRPNDPFPFTENNWAFCEWDADVGQHTITLTAQSSGRGFNFDYLDYAPADNADVSNADMLYQWTDSSIQFGSSGWHPLGDLGQMAPTAGAVVTIQFYGTAVSWYGTTPRELPGAPSSASYSIDDEAERTFTVPGDHGGTTQFNTLIFKTHDVPLGHHTLRVVSGGTTQQVPLVLGTYIAEGGAVQPPPRSGGSSGGSNSGSGGSGSNNSGGNSSGGTPVTNGTNTVTQTDGSGRPVQTGGGSGHRSPNSPNSSNDNRTATDRMVGATSGLAPGAIAGIVVAFVGLIVLGVSFFLCYRRRQRRAPRLLNTSGGPVSPLGDSSMHVVPFSGSPSSLQGSARLLNPFATPPPATATTIPSFYPGARPASPTSTANDNAVSPVTTSTNIYLSSDTRSTYQSSTASGPSVGQPVTFQPFNPLPAKFDPRPPVPVARYDIPLEEQPPHYSPS